MTKAQKIKTVRAMADRIRYVCTCKGIHRFDEMERFIEEGEKRHRKGSPRRYAQSKGVAVDYFIVRCFAEAFRLLDSKPSADELLKAMQVRTDYLLALVIVAGYRDDITSSIATGDLYEADDMLDYFTDIAGHRRA
tara:strand:+ start:3448 stop:3855 length:408 start_codon:yes stop_codon:yes gene_type:complete